MSNYWHYQLKLVEETRGLLQDILMLSTESRILPSCYPEDCNCMARMHVPASSLLFSWCSLLTQFGSSYRAQVFSSSFFSTSTSEMMTLRQELHWL